MPKTMVEWALAYAALGWKVFPLKSVGDLKTPHSMLGGGGANGHHRATTDESTIREWWRRSPKSGIAVNLAASGLMAVDIDPKDGGFEKLKRLEGVYGALKTPVVQVSGSGGRHMLYVLREGVRVPGKLHGQKGIDLKANGYIVLAPSPHSVKDPQTKQPVPTGKTYAWLKGHDPFENADFIPKMPMWLTEGDSLPAIRANGPVDPDDVFANDAQKAGLTLDQIADYLKAVSNEDDDIDYETWFNIIAGIWHETDGSAEGEELARSWSEQSLKHDDQKFNKSWRSADHRGKGAAPVTIRLLIKMAGERRREEASARVAELRLLLKNAQTPANIRAVCVEIKKTPMDQLDRSDLRAEVRKRHKSLTDNLMTIADARALTNYEDPEAKVIPKWLEQYVYLSSEDVFLRRRSQTTLTKQAFDNTYNVKMLTKQERLEGISFPAETASNAALNRYEIPRAVRRMYLPGEDDTFTFDGETCFNTYTNARQPEVPDKLSLSERQAIETLERHFAHVTEDERERAILISWLAHIVQTNRRNNWCIIIQSLEGDGKSVFSRLMGAVLGASNVQVLDTTAIQDKFTGWAKGHQLKIIEEIKLHGQNRFDVLDKMKPFITNDVVTIRDLNTKVENIVNTCSYLAFTNWRDALPVNDTDTRYFMIASPRQTIEEVKAFKAANPTYFADLFNAIDRHPGALRGFFLDYELHPEFSPTARAPESKEKTYIIELNKSDLQHDIEDAIEGGGSATFSQTLFDVTLFADKMREETGSAPAGKTLQSLLQKMGYQSLGRFKVESRKHTYWSRSPKKFGKPNTTATGQRIREYILRSDTSDL